MPVAFADRGIPITPDDIQNAAAALGGDQAALWSLIAVETQGFGFLRDRRPCILFERHIFRLRTGGKYDQHYPGLSNRNPGGYLGGAAEYDRLGKAMELNEQAALESTSWGLGQVMGFNAVVAGFPDVYAMIAAMVAGEGAQLSATANFITANPPLRAAFHDHDWSRIAFYYNGPDYARNHYGENLEIHYENFSIPGNRPKIDVRTTQVCLFYLDYLLSGVDGLYGPQTMAAVRAFRLGSGLPAGDLDANVIGLLRSDANI